MSSRVESYIPLAQAFAARSAFFHEAVAAKLGLHGTDVKVLRLVEATPRAPSELATELGLTNAALTAVVDRLESAGFATRVRDAHDRRRITVHVVPAKMRKLDKLYDGQRAAMAKLLGRYDASEWSAIADFLERTAEVLIAETGKLRDV